MIFANMLWGKRISVTCDKPSDFKFCSKLGHLLAYFGFSFLRNRSADFQSTKKGSSPLSTIYSRFLSQHFIFILTFAIFPLFEAVFCYAAQALLTLETSSCLAFLMPSVQSLPSYSLRSAWHSYPCQMRDFLFYFLPLFHMLAGAYECFFWHSGFFSLKPSPFVNTAVYQTFVPNSK